MVEVGAAIVGQQRSQILTPMWPRCESGTKEWTRVASCIWRAWYQGPMLVRVKSSSISVGNRKVAGLEGLVPAFSSCAVMLRKV